MLPRNARLGARLSPLALATVLSLPLAVVDVSAQAPADAEVRQLVLFHFVPGRAVEAIALFRDRAVPLYRENEAMRSFRGFREVESPTPLDLVVVSSFRGMRGMDRSNEALRELAAEAGSSIGGLYGAISALSQSHEDHFIEMLPRLTTGDASASRLTAIVWYQVVPGRFGSFELALGEATVPFERSLGTPTATGRVLLSDGWHYVRFLGFDSLGHYHDYWTARAASPGHTRLDDLTIRRREMLLASVPTLAVR